MSEASAASQRAADGLLINGSVNNGASSPFAQLQAFGNNRRGVRSLYNGSLGFNNLDISGLDARNYSLTGQDTPKPGYNHFTGLACVRRSAEDSRPDQSEWAELYRQLPVAAQSQRLDANRVDADGRAADAAICRVSPSRSRRSARRLSRC